MMAGLLNCKSIKAFWWYSRSWEKDSCRKRQWFITPTGNTFCPSHFYLSLLWKDFNPSLKHIKKKSVMMIKFCCNENWRSWTVISGDRKVKNKELKIHKLHTKLVEQLPLFNCLLWANEGSFFLFIPKSVPLKASYTICSFEPWNPGFWMLSKSSISEALATQIGFISISAYDSLIWGLLKCILVQLIRKTV